eukprot:jgi/Botrbrau1/15080/Bobra.0286s0009.1
MGAHTVNICDLVLYGSGLSPVGRLRYWSLSLLLITLPAVSLFLSVCGKGGPHPLSHVTWEGGLGRGVPVGNQSDYEVLVEHNAVIKLFLFPTLVGDLSVACSVLRV